MTLHRGVTGGLSLGDVTSLVFFSCLDYGAKRPEGQSVSQVKGSLAGNWASGDLVCPQAGVGPGIFLPNVICPPAAAAGAAGQVYYGTTNTAAAPSLLWFRTL